MGVSRPGLPAGADISLWSELQRLREDVRLLKEGRVAGAWRATSAPTGLVGAPGDIIRHSSPKLSVSGATQFIVDGWKCADEGSGTLSWFPIKLYQVDATGGGGGGTSGSATNVGTGVGLFIAESGGVLGFRTLKAGANITLSTSGNEVVITSTAAGGSSGSATNVGTGAGLYLGETGGILGFRTLKAGANATISVSGNEIVIDSLGGGGGARITITTSAPAWTTTAGDLWWDSTNGALKIYYDDGSSAQWVDASPIPAPASVMASTVLGYDTATVTYSLATDTMTDTTLKRNDGTTTLQVSFSCSTTINVCVEFVALGQKTTYGVRGSIYMDGSPAYPNVAAATFVRKFVCRPNTDNALVFQGNGIFPVNPGNHTIDVRWQANGSTTVLQWFDRYILVSKLPF